MTPHPNDQARPGTGFRSRQLLAGLAVSVLSVGCDIPTDPPEVESRWIVPAEETRFGVAELLPGDVSLTPDSSAFVVDFDPVAFSQSLGGLCAVCVAADGTTVPKPVFTGGFSSTISFPPEVLSIEVLDGQVRLEIFNGFNFDPIRPAAGVFGSLELTITDEADGDVVGTLTVDGQDQAFPGGTTLTEFVDLGAATIDGAIEATILVDSPTGDPVTIDASDLVSVDATPLNVRVASVEIDVASQSVTFDPVSLDLEDIDEELIDRVVSGSFDLDVVNPFQVQADFDFTGDEIRSFLGEPGVVLSGGAVVDPAAGAIVVDPGQELVLNAALDVVVRIGGEG